MKENNSTTFIIFTGLTILCIFTAVATINLLPEHNKSNAYYTKVDEEIDGKIESININSNKLNIITSGNIIEYCIKTTKTPPKQNNICWKKINNNNITTAIYPDKKYYIWIKDNQNKISTPTSINPR